MGMASAAGAGFGATLRKASGVCVFWRRATPHSSPLVHGSPLAAPRPRRTAPRPPSKNHRTRPRSTPHGAAPLVRTSRRHAPHFGDRPRIPPCPQRAVSRDAIRRNDIIFFTPPPELAAIASIGGGGGPAAAAGSVGGGGGGGGGARLRESDLSSSSVPSRSAAPSSPPTCAATRSASCLAALSSRSAGRCRPVIQGATSAASSRSASSTGCSRAAPRTSTPCPTMRCEWPPTRVVRPREERTFVRPGFLDEK